LIKQKGNDTIVGKNFWVGALPMEKSKIDVAEDPEISRKAIRSSVRKEMIALRKGTSAEVQQAESNAIFEKIYEMPEYAAATEVFLYASVNGEVATENFAKKVLADGKKLAYPVSEKGSSDMEFYYINSLSVLTPGFMKIPEPKASAHNIAIPSAESPSIIIVPGVAFDKDRNRLGYGAGYYDKYLALHSNAFMKKIAVSYSFQVVEALPNESHDMKPDVVVTGSRVIE
jgi:5-formyltetrahydrofolate cyclo-ligase